MDSSNEHERRVPLEARFADEDAVLARAEQEFEQASHQFREGKLGREGLEQAAEHIDSVAQGLEDEGARMEMGALSQSLRALPDTIERERASRPEADSRIVDEAEQLVAWAWQELPTIDARIERVRDAIDRIDRLPKGDVDEQYLITAQRTRLLDLSTALEVNRG
jgi:hypothetical protein